MTNPTVEFFRKQIADAESEILSLDALISALEDVPENSTQLGSLRRLRKMFEDNIAKWKDSIEAIQ